MTGKWKKLPEIVAAKFVSPRMRKTPREMENDYPGKTLYSLSTLAVKYMPNLSIFTDSEGIFH